MTPVERLKELLAEATPRPWFNDDGDAVSSKAMYDPFTGDYNSTLFFESGDPVDASLIVAAVNALPALLDIARAAGKVKCPNDGTRGFEGNLTACGCSVCRLHAALARLETP